MHTTTPTLEMVRRTKPEAQATRDHLLDTAEQVILQRGLAGCALQDIAQAAGLSRGAIYWHFADKLALFRAIMDRVDLPLEQAVAAATRLLDAPAGAGPPPNPLPILRRLALAPFEMMQNDLRARRAFTILLHRTEFVGELAPLAKRQADAIEAFLDLMTRLFQALARYPGPAGAPVLAAGVEPRAAATALVAIIDGLLRLGTLPVELGATPPVQASAVAPAIDALLRGFGTPA